MQNDKYEALSKVPEGDPRILVNQNPCHDTRRNRRRLGDHDLAARRPKSHNGGYLIGTGIFFAVFVAAVIAQIFKKVQPLDLLAGHVASTTVGTALADFFDRSLGIGYTGGSSILLACVLCSLAIWYLALGSINVQTVATPKVEIFYWVTITFSQTLGTALRDWIADSTGLGYDGGALVFGAGLVVLAILYYWTTISRVLLFWAAFILTRPLGATVGDFLDKPTSHGGWRSVVPWLRE